MEADERMRLLLEQAAARGEIPTWSTPAELAELSMRAAHEGRGLSH